APVSCCCFFFQAEDGIRDFHVTGVQTCALPIFDGRPRDAVDRLRAVAAGDDAMVVTRFSLQRALAAAGDAEAAAEQAAWLAAHRGRAYIERPGNDLLSPVAVAARRLAYVPEAAAPR